MVPAGRVNTQDFYVQSLASSGVVGYTVSAAGYGNATGSATLTPSGFFLFTPGGRGLSFITNTGSGDSPLSVQPARLDGDLRFAESQNIRGGLSVDVNVISTDHAIGVVTVSPAQLWSVPPTRRNSAVPSARRRTDHTRR